MSLPSAVFNRWRHYHERDEGEVAVYRPASAEFPRSRGRDGIEFRRDGTCVYVEIAPGDGTIDVSGRWETLEDDRVRLTLEDDRTYTLELIDAASDELRVRWE